MNQDHVLLVFKFPEDDAETFMPYTSDEVSDAKRDAVAFSEMYPGVLFAYVVFVFQDGREEEVFRWSNPLAVKLINLINSAGGVMQLSPMSLGFVNPAGSFFRKLSKAFSNPALAVRPPLAEQFASPLPSESKTFGGRNRRTRRR